MGLSAVATELPDMRVASAEAILREVLNPKIRAFIEYWRAVSPPGRLPGRQHLSPSEIPALLPNLWLIDVEQSPRLRFRYRLIGTGVARAFSQDRTGRYLDEVHPRFADSPVAGYLLEVVNSGLPSWRIGKPVFGELKEFLRLERIYLPAARDGVNVDMVFALTVFLNRFGEEF